MNGIIQVRNRWPHQFGIAIAGLLLALSVGCAPVSIQPSEQAAPSATRPPATAITPPVTATSEVLTPAGWATYTNTQRCEYTISYPLEMQVVDQGAYSQIVGFKLTDPGAGPRNFLYVSVIDGEIQDLGEEVIYNYDPAEAEILLNMQVGESKSVRDIADVSAWFTYQRMPDTLIGGHAALTYENVQPWEFPDGTKELRYLLSLNGCTYLIGGYMDMMNSDLRGAITEELFNQVIATIRLGP